MQLMRLVGITRWLMILAVLGCIALATTVLVYSSIDIALVIRDTIGGDVSRKGGKVLAVHGIEILDRYLFAAVAYVVALGLFALFVDDRVPVPKWLEIHSLDDLKNKLLRLIVLVMAVVFLGQLAAWDGGWEIAALGGGIAAIIGALGYFSRVENH